MKGTCRLEQLLDGGELIGQLPHNATLLEWQLRGGTQLANCPEDTLVLLKKLNEHQ